MAFAAFTDLRTTIFSLYSQGEYSRALALLDEEAGAFPDEAGRISYWCACLSCRLNDDAGALGAMGAAVDRGFWLAPGILRRDPDLKPLQGLPEFEQLVAVCGERMAEAQAAAAPLKVVLQPESGAGALPLLVAMHGNGGTVAETVGHWRPAAAEGWLVVLPQSSRVTGPDGFGWDDRQLGEAEVKDHLAAVYGGHSVDRSRVVFGGFSMGAALALWMALRGVEGARGFILAAPTLPPQEELKSLLVQRPPSPLRGVVIIGAKDAFAHGPALAAVALLREHGVSCEVHEYPELGHVYPPDFGSKLGEVLRYLCS